MLESTFFNNSIRLLLSLPMKGRLSNVPGGCLKVGGVEGSEMQTLMITADSL